MYWCIYLSFKPIASNQFRKQFLNISYLQATMLHVGNTNLNMGSTMHSRDYMYRPWYDI